MGRGNVLCCLMNHSGGMAGTGGGLSLWLHLWFSHAHYSDSSKIFSQTSCELSFCPPGTSKGSYPFTHSMNPHLQPRLYHGCYGDIMDMEASGVACDITRLMNCGKWKAKQTFGFPPLVIFGFFLKK